jgi:hypothetical protein
MPEVTTPIPGTFCWIENATNDPAAMKSFYGELFGWTYTDMPMPDGSAYAMATIGGKFTCGVMQLPDSAKAMGAPPHFAQYVAVTDAAATAEKAAALGGKVLAGPMQAGPGTMAVLQDPTGAVLCVWQQHQSMGSFLSGEPGSLGWNELTTTDVDRAGKFYTNLFGWKPQAQDMGGLVYTVFNNGESPAAGMMPQPGEMAGAPSAWTAYLAVADCDGSVAKAKSLGGTVVVPPRDIPNIGRFACLTDPQGAFFAVIRFFPQPTR